MDIFEKIKKNLNESGKNLVVMVGPPGSGKSRIADKLVSDCGFVKVSPNDIRAETTGDPYDQSDNKTIFNIVYSRIGRYLDNGLNVVYDATNCRSQYRYRFMDYVGDKSAMNICVCATTGVYDCINTVRKNGIDISDERISSMRETLRKHPPSVFEGFDVVLKFDGSEL